MSKRVFAFTILFITQRNCELAAQSRNRDLPRLFRSIAGVTLNRDSAASLRTKFGATREREVGEGHDRYAAWCYVPAHDSAVVLELMSDISDMGTPGRALNVIRLRANAPSGDREGCASLRATTANLSPGGLRLGLTRARIENLLGQPTRVTADSLIYDFAAKEYMRPGSPEYRRWNTQEHRKSCFEGGPPYASVGGTAIVVLQDGRAVEIRLERYGQATC
jgi:hypothetical protein